jgi:hypothetical protein
MGFNSAFKGLISSEITSTSKYSVRSTKTRQDKTFKCSQIYCPYFTVFNEISSISVSPLQIKRSFSKDVMLLLSNTSFRTFVGKIKGYSLMMNLKRRPYIPLGHTNLPHFTLLPMLLAGSPTATRIL